MELKHFVTALENIDALLLQIIGAMKATILKRTESSESYNFSSASEQVSVALPKEEIIKYKGKTIKKRADGRYWTRFYGKDGKQQSVYGKTQKECLQNLKKALKEKDLPVAAPKELTLGEWLNEWLKLYKVGQVKDSTLYKTKMYVKQLVPLHECKLAELTTLELQQYLMRIEQPRKRELLYVTLNDALQRAMDAGLIRLNPMKLTKIPKCKRKPKKALTKDEEKRIVEACKTDSCGIMFLFCLFEGMRIGEVKALTERDVDTEKNVIYINKAINDFNKVDTPKSETSNRTIPIFARMRQALQEMPFRRITGDNHIYEHWESICEKAGVQCNVHSLRHTFATRCAEAGIAPKLTQQWLGHSTIQVTMDVYTHINAEFEAQQTVQFDTYFDT